MVLPIALLTVGAIFIIAGFTGRSITEVINGDAPKPEGDPEENYAGTKGGADTTEDPSINMGTPRGITRVKPVMIDGKRVAGWLAEIVAFAKMNGWNGTVTSGIRSDAEQRAACRGVCGNEQGCPGRCAKPGQSNHRGALFPLGAVDVTDPSGFWRAIQSYPGGPPVKNSLGAQDPVHFSRSGH